jgi:hypothetical protein
MPGVRSFIPGKPSQSGYKMESAPFPERVFEAGFGRVCGRAMAGSSHHLVEEILEGRSKCSQHAQVVRL